MKEKTILFQYNIDSYGNPTSTKIKEVAQVSPLKYTIQLEQIPDEQFGVTLLNSDNTSMFQVFNYDDVEKIENSYYINYTNGLIYFNSNQGAEKKVVNYYGTGVELISCKRVFDGHYDANGQWIVEILQDIIDAGREAIEAMKTIGDVTIILQMLEDKIAEGDLKLQKLQNAIDEANDLTKTTENERIIIDASNWIYNPTTKMYEYTIAHTMNSTNLIIDCYNNDTNEFVFCGGKIIDASSVLIQHDEAINLKVVLNARYFKVSDFDYIIEDLADKLQDTIDEANDLIKATGNEEIIIYTSDWVYNSTAEMYEYTITHTMSSTNLIINCYDNDTNEFVFCAGKIIDASSVLIQHEENINLKVVLNARYYKATLTISDDIAQEVIDARGGKNSLGNRINLVESDVNNLNSEVEKIHNDFYNVKVIDLKNEEDFDINNISTCVNRVFSTIGNYTTVKLNTDLCYITTPIDITMKEGCELILNCKIKCKTDFNAININGGCASNNVFIKSLESFDKVNFNTTLGRGLTLDNYYNSSISIGEILGFNIGLLIKGTLGSQYNKIDFFSISNCNECIVLNPVSGSHWVNENTFTGGRLGGNVSIHLKGISNSDIINNNKFYNIGFEGVKTLLIKAVGARYNSLVNPRVLEDYPTTRWIEEDGSCIGNEYNFTFPVKASLFKLDYLSEINAPLTTDNGKMITQLGAVCDWDITSGTMKLQYKYLLNGILMTDNDFNNAGGTITLEECFKEVYCKLSTSTRILRIAKHLLYNGFSFNLYITSASSGSLKLEYYNKNGGVTSGTNFLGNGVYKVTMYNDILVYTKIGDEFKMV